MSGGDLSPDGEWMWNGTEWIPAPPQNSPELNHSKNQNNASRRSIAEITQASYYAPINSSTKSINPKNRNYKVGTSFSNKQLPWLGVVLIVVSMFLPYISIAGLIEWTGFEMMGTIGELMNEIVGDTGGSGGGSGGSGTGESDIAGDEFALMIAAFLFLISPFFFILSALISAIVLFKGNSPRIMGGLHLTYSAAFIICATLAPTALGISIFDFVGAGFYMGAFSSILLMIK
jgi:hypothetical protein